MIRAFSVFATVMSLTIAGYASSPLEAEPFATIDLSRLPAGTKDASATSIAFISDTSIAISLCPNDPPMDCSVSLLRRDGKTFRPYAASTLPLGRGRSIHVSSEGGILITPFGALPAILLTPDLSARRGLPNIFSASSSGNTGAEMTKNGWKLYQIRSPELIRDGKGNFRSLSDEVVVFQEGNVMRIETLQGTPLGSFPVKPETKCYNTVYPLRENRLYFDDCKKIQIVDFSGREQSKLHAPSGWRDHQFWSRDGKRTLFDNFDRKVSIFRSAGELLLALGTLGVGALDEQDNREDVLVLDTATGDSCFSWKRRFPMGSVGLVQDAAISPSGEFVAIAAQGILSVYRLPEHCGHTK